MHSVGWLLERFHTVGPTSRRKLRGWKEDSTLNDKGGS